MQRLAWAEALRKTRQATLTKILPEPPSHHHSSRWMELGELLREQHVELAADGLHFGDVAERGAHGLARRGSRGGVTGVWCRRRRLLGCAGCEREQDEGELRDGAHGVVDHTTVGGLAFAAS